MRLPIASLKPALSGGVAQPTSRRARFRQEPPPAERHPRGELGRPSQAHMYNCHRGEAPVAVALR
eukprot:6528067-Alexandrium_andersonii.AAC.1